MNKKTKPKKTGRVAYVTVSRLYNLGNYENVKYELSAEIAKGQSPSETLIKLVETIHALKPIGRPHYTDSLASARKKKLSERNEYEKEHYAAWLEEEKRFRDAQERRRQAVLDLDKLGGNSTRKDGKDSWDSTDTPW